MQCRRSDIAKQARATATCAAAMTSGTADDRHCNLHRARRILGWYRGCTFEEIAMRCLHHVFLRGGLALLLLAGVGASALAWPAHACTTAAQSDASRTAHVHC